MSQQRASPLPSPGSSFSSPWVWILRLLPSKFPAPRSLLPREGDCRSHAGSLQSQATDWRWEVITVFFLVELNFQRKFPFCLIMIPQSLSVQGFPLPSLSWGYMSFSWDPRRCHLSVPASTETPHIPSTRGFVVHTPRAATCSRLTPHVSPGWQPLGAMSSPLAATWEGPFCCLPPMRGYLGTR